jgi:hypothetical protein
MHDDLLASPCEPEEAIIVYAGEIAGAKEAVLEGDASLKKTAGGANCRMEQPGTALFIRSIKTRFTTASRQRGVLNCTGESESTKKPVWEKARLRLRWN